MKTKAAAKGLKISARKLRLSADMVRGSRVGEAEQILRATPTKGAVMVAAALKSAVANAENNHNARKAGLHIATITVDEGPHSRRFRPRSRGMASPILHRTSHLTIVVSDEAVVTKKSKSVKQSMKSATAATLTPESKPAADKPKKEAK